MSRLIDADEIFYDQLLNTGRKEHPLEFAVSKKRIDDMPTIEPQQWIPVTKRLPDSDDVVLVCYKDGSISTNWVGVHDNIREWVYDKEHVVAWMPLPEPPRFFANNHTD